MRRVVIIAALLVGARAAEACAPCNCGDATLTAPGVEKPYKNRIRFALESRAGHYSVGDQSYGWSTWFLRNALTATWSPLTRLTVGATLPWMTSWQSGDAQQVVNGLADLEVFGRVVMFRERTFAPRHLFWGTLGLKTPTGPRLQDDRGLYYSDDDQPGSGSWDPFFGLHYGYFGGLLSWFASTSYRATTPNERGYRRGATLVASTAAQLQTVEWAAISLGLDAIWMPPDRLGNGNDFPNTGLFTVRAVPALLLMPTMDWLLRLAVEVPVAHVFYGMQSEGPQVVLTVAYDLH